MRQDNVDEMQSYRLERRAEHIVFALFTLETSSNVRSTRGLTYLVMGLVVHILQYKTLYVEACIRVSTTESRRYQVRGQRPIVHHWTN